MVIGAQLPQLPTNGYPRWEAPCLQLISLDFSGHMTALCIPEPGIYHLTSVFVICRVSILGKTPFLHNCYPSENQGLHILCLHFLKCFSLLAREFCHLNPQTASKPSISEGGPGMVSSMSRAHTNHSCWALVSSVAGLSSVWRVLEKLHNLLLPFCCVPGNQTAQGYSYLRLFYTWLSRFQTKKQINLFPIYIT